jgi:predicted ATPase
MNASDKAHLRAAAQRGECTKEYAEQLIREAEQRAGVELPAHAPGYFDEGRTLTTNGTGA